MATEASQHQNTKLPRVAIITPYHRETLGQLRLCHKSVLAQTHPCLHVMVADGFPRMLLDYWQLDHIRLPRAHGDIGSTPRLIGAYHAIGLGMDAVAFLDADNCYKPYHIEHLVELRSRTGAAFLSSSRELYSLDGSSMGPCPISDPDRFVDTNCMMFWREAFPLLHHWGLMPSYAHLVGDRVMLQQVRRSGLPMASSSRTSVIYKCSKAGLYNLLGKQPPRGVLPRPNYEAAATQWEKDGHPPLAL
jgi:hypothetical protein